MSLIESTVIFIFIITLGISVMEANMIWNFAKTKFRNILTRIKKKPVKKEVTIEKQKEITEDKLEYSVFNTLEILKKSNLSVEELLVFLSNIMYSIGASITRDNPSLEEIPKLYYANPNNVGYALMMQAIDMNSKWVADLKEIMQNNKGEKK